MRKVPVIAFSIPLVAALAVAADPAPYSDIEVSKTSDEDHTVMKVTIDGLPTGKKWRDLHITPLPPPDAPPPAPGTTPPTYKLPKPKTKEVKVTDSRGKDKGTAKVETDPKSGEAHVTMDPGLPDGQYYIDIPWDTPSDIKSPNCGWSIVCTTNGDKAYTPGDKIDSGSSGNDPKVPGIKTAMTGPGGGGSITCALGAATPVEIACGGADLGACGFQVFTSRTLNEEYEDPLHIGINTESDPVPPAWGLVFCGFSGTLTPEGHAAAPVTITVPAEPALSGSTFYAVVALLDVNGEHWVASDPVQITIP
jgi:hypothetical protein